MRTPTNLTRSLPFWGLVAGSLAAVGGGTWIAVSRIRTMTKALNDGSATGVEVYAGQTWAALGAVVLGAGIVGLLLALSLSAARALVPAATEVVAPIERNDEDEAFAQGEAVVEAPAAREPAAETAVVGTSDEAVVSR